MWPQVAGRYPAGTPERWKWSRCLSTEDETVYYVASGSGEFAVCRD